MRSEFSKIKEVAQDIIDCVSNMEDLYVSKEIGLKQISSLNVEIVDHLSDIEDEILNEKILNNELDRVIEAGDRFLIDILGDGDIEYVAAQVGCMKFSLISTENWNRFNDPISKENFSIRFLLSNSDGGIKMERMKS